MEGTVLGIIFVGIILIGFPVSMYFASKYGKPLGKLKERESSVNGDVKRIYEKIKRFFEKTKKEKDITYSHKDNGKSFREVKDDATPHKDDGFTPVERWIKNEQLKCDYTGVYILHNINKDKYYVGQAKNVGKRINQHKTGRGGNPDVYFDWRSGDTFYIKTISLSESEFDNLDRLEKYKIEEYRANISGYNKTVGNQA